jgi:hypothetical protein
LFFNSALKEYSAYGSDPEKTYKHRRLSIRTYLPTQSGFDVQRCIEDLNDDLAILKNEVEECKNAILEIRQKRDPEITKRKFNVSWSLSTHSSEVIDCFRDVIDDRKRTAQWIRRERAIYLWELRLRKVEALKLPLIRYRLDTLNKEASGIVVNLKGHMEQVNRLLVRYQQVSCETSGLENKVHKLSLENQPSTIMLPRVPSHMQETTQKQLKELNETCVGLN